MSNYKRKTEDEFQIHGYYPGTGWEEVTCEVTREAARSSLKEYRENDPGTAYKMVKKRVKKDIREIPITVDLLRTNHVVEFG